jgi:hypothetical protein
MALLFWGKSRHWKCLKIPQNASDRWSETVTCWDTFWFTRVSWSCQGSEIAHDAMCSDSDLHMHQHQYSNICGPRTLSSVWSHNLIPPKASPEHTHSIHVSMINNLKSKNLFLFPLLYISHNPMQMQRCLTNIINQDSIVSIVTRLWSGWLWLTNYTTPPEDCYFPTESSYVFCWINSMKPSEWVYWTLS